MGVLASFTSDYTPAESWAYDLLIAPAVDRLGEPLRGAAIEAAPRGGRVLDVGCGGGHNAVGLSRLRPDLEVVGLDISAEQIARARKRAAHAGVAARFEQGSALDMPYPDGCFDAVVSIASIKHWPDPAQGLRECARVLRPGGALRVVEADRGCRLEDARAFVDAWRVPGPVKLLALPFFCTFVAGRSLEVDEVRALCEPLPLGGVEVARMAGLPAWELRAVRS